MTTAIEVKQILHRAFPLPEWAFFAELRTRTGYSKTYGRDADSERYIDAFAMHMYPSKNFLRYAFEIKVSRSDWLREKDDFQKRAHAFYLSHRFYYVFGDESIYRMKDDGYFLNGCGIYVVTNGKLVLKEEAALRQPFPMPETFIASLLRRSCGVPEPEPPQPTQSALIPANGGLFDAVDRQEEEVSA